MSQGELILERLRGMTRDQLIHELEYAHSDEFVVIFLGYLAADLDKRGGFVHEPPDLLDVWQRFKAEMGKKGIR